MKIQSHPAVCKMEYVELLLTPLVQANEPGLTNHTEKRELCHADYSVLSFFHG